MVEACLPTKKRAWDGGSQDSEYIRDLLQRAFLGMAIQLQFTYHFTLRFEASLREPEMRSRLGGIGAMLDRYLLGKRWCYHPDRCRWIAIAEDSQHAHLLLRMPEGRELSRYRNYYQFQHHLLVFWESRLKKKRLIADLDVERIPQNDIPQVANYVSKKAFEREAWNSTKRWILAEEFHAQRRYFEAQGHDPDFPAGSGLRSLDLSTRRLRPHVQ